MSKFLYWIIVAPLAVAVIVFSVNNRTDVVLDLWPLDGLDTPVPVFAAVLVAVVAGFIAGGLVAWTSAGKSRSRARTEARRANQAERDLEAAHDHIERLQAEAARAKEDLLQGDTHKGDTPMLPPDSY